MKKALVVLTLVFICITAKSQYPIFLHGDKNVNIGLGFNFYPVLSASVDYCIADAVAEFGSIGVGPYLGLGISAMYSHLSGGVRGTFHYPLVDKLDTYAGLGVGVRYDFSSFYQNNLHFIPGIFLGANYPLNNNLNVFGELGAGAAYLNFGVTFKL